MECGRGAPSRALGAAPAHTPQVNAGQWAGGAVCSGGLPGVSRALSCRFQVPSMAQRPWDTWPSSDSLSNERGHLSVVDVRGGAGAGVVQHLQYRGSDDSEAAGSACS